MRVDAGPFLPTSPADFSSLFHKKKFLGCGEHGEKGVEKRSFSEIENGEWGVDEVNSLHGVCA